MTLDRAATYNGLKVCTHCGWPMAGPFEEKRHREGCEYVKKGRQASALAARVPNLVSTKFGYGTGELVFTIAPHFTVQVTPNGHGGFAMREVHLLDTLTEDDAASFVEAIAAWHRGRDPGKKTT